MKNIKYAPFKKMTPWRKISLASWKPTGDSSTYCLEDIIVDDLLAYCEEKEISIHTFFIKAISNTIKKHPKINSTIRWGKIFQRENVSIFFHTIVDSKTDDLSGILIEDGQQRTLSDLNIEFLHKTSLAKQGINNYTASKKIIGILPSFLTKITTRVYSFFAYTINWNWSVFKSPSNAYGSIMLTSVGSLGLSKALCPISPYTKVPMVISTGKIEEKPVVIANEIQVKKVITFGFTFDHRIMDGIHFSEFFACLKQYITEPNRIDDA